MVYSSQKPSEVDYTERAWVTQDYSKLPWQSEGLNLGLLDLVWHHKPLSQNHQWCSENSKYNSILKAITNSFLLSFPSNKHLHVLVYWKQPIGISWQDLRPPVPGIMQKKVIWPKRLWMSEPFNLSHLGTIWQKRKALPANLIYKISILLNPKRNTRLQLSAADTKENPHSHTRKQLHLKWNKGESFQPMAQWSWNNLAHLKWQSKSSGVPI